MKRFLILYHPRVPEAESLAQAIAGRLRTHYGVAARCTMSNGPDLTESPDDVDMMLAIGGDGTMIGVGRLGARYNCPVLGVNMGRLGFLSEVQPAEWQKALTQVLAGNYRLEERMLVYAEHWRQETCLEGNHALNEVVVTRGALARPVRLETRIDSSELTTYLADGLIVSTPTGSTAYSLAAGGPILPPELRNLVMIPVAAHMSFDRAIVLAQGMTIDIVVHTDHQAILSADGQVEIELMDGDRVHVRASELIARFVRLQDCSYFYRNLTSHMACKRR